MTAPEPSRASQPAANRIAAAICLVAVAGCWSLQYPFWPNRERLLDQGKIVDYSWLAFAAWAIGLLAWVACLAVVLPGLRGHTFGEHRVLVTLTTTGLMLAFGAMYPTNAIDVYIYAARSRLLTHYGENPNAMTPERHWDADPYMHFASNEWADNLSPYGPLWNQLAAPVTWLGGDNIGAAVIGFKLLSVIAAVAIAMLVYDIVRQRHPEWALPATLFWLWNPLLLWDGVANAHNDVTLMLPVVAAIWAWQRGYLRWVVPLLLASVLIKYVTIILLPIAVAALWKRAADGLARLADALWSAAWVLMLFAIALFPFYNLDAIRRSAEEQGLRMATSPAWAFLASAHESGIAQPEAETVRNVCYAIVNLVILAWIIACWRQPSRFPLAAFEVTFAFMLVASTNQRPWYVIWLVPLAALLVPENPWRRAGIWSITSMCAHACTIWLWYVWDFDAWGSFWYFMIITAVIFVPVLLVTGWELWPRLAPAWGGRGKAGTLAR